MKHRLLLPALLILASLPAHAQRLTSSSIVRTEGQAPLQPVSHSELPEMAAPASSRTFTNPHAKMTGAAFYSETFPSLPAGWTATANAGSINGWRWAKAAPTGAGNSFPINGLINSDTKSDGWLLYNADSVMNNAGSTRPFGGSISSTPIPVGPTHTKVMLSFQQYYRHSDGDTCFVDVSRDGTNWTAYRIHPNLELTQFGFLYSDPTITTINISSVVGGQANAYIRFRFNSTAPTYCFNWLIDDLKLYDADAINLGLTYSGIASVSAPTSDGFTTSYGFSSIPLSMADTVFPITYLSNYGLSAASNVDVTASYYHNNTLLTTQTMTYPSLPLDARDSALVFSAGYKPTATGNYFVAFSVSQAGDGAPGNNVDTIRFAVTDSVYASHGAAFTERNCFLNHQGAAAAQYWGARFTIGNGQHDTLTTVSVAFRPETAVGERVQAQLYRASGSGSTFSWIPFVYSPTYTLTAADISTPGNVVITSIPFRAPGGVMTQLILGDGDYAIVLTPVNSTKDIAIYSMKPPMPTAPAFIGYQGQSDESPNDGSLGFAAAGGIATGLVEVPYVRPNFGNTKALIPVSVRDMEPVVLGIAYPNPANTMVHIPVIAQQSASAQLVLSNSIGQVVDQIDLGRLTAGVMNTATIPTGKLPEGVYFYSVRTEGGQAAGRILVKH